MQLLLGVRDSHCLFQYFCRFPQLSKSAFFLLLAVEKSDTFASLIIFFFSLISQLCKMLLDQFAQPFGSVGGKPITQRRYMVTIAGEMLGKFWA